MAELAQFLVSPDASIRDVMAFMDRNARGIALVADGEFRLLGTVTDGDIRRAILAGIELASGVGELLRYKAQTPYARAITAPKGTGSAHLFRLMRRHRVRHIPLLDEDGRVVDVITGGDETFPKTLPVAAVIMAGGYGTRLRPLTQDVPKPMLPVGGRPVIEWIVRGLRDAGVAHITVTTHYKAEVITRHFGDGAGCGVEISYLHEDKPSGTLGPLRLLESWDRPLLVINGDILTQVGFARMLEYHRERKAAMTVAICDYSFKVPYGIVEMDGERIRGLVEKPLRHFFVNAGIYLLEPSVRSTVLEGGPGDMTGLISRLVEKGEVVAGFPVREYWNDIGRFEDYEQAKKDMRDGI